MFLAIDYTREESIVQEFLENAILIDGRRFDIGIYVTITSLDPLRIYILDEWRVK